MNKSTPSVETILGQAVEIAVPAERQAFVEEACGGDPALQRLVERLIANHFQAGSFLEQPAVALDPEEIAGWETASTAYGPGTVIGPYKLLEQIGEGGMGLVFVAEQQQPVKRRVALKIIKPGMDSRQVIARFEAERQALALMDHPNIAKVHDGGATPEGRPFFVMEFVRGTPITDYCDSRRLTTRQRLELLIDVCHAVQHAHQKGIIHRDLKPSNVLVEVHDVRPVVKVIDFGIAKATGQLLTEKTLYTGVAQLIGTPLYMSPEQAGLSSLDVDTRSDVYSLGVLLYELLTGTTPFDSEALKKAGYDEMRRIIREDEPPRPSARLSTMQQAHLSTVAERRGQEPQRLTRHVRGELDWIVMKALEKDRNRRYESASTFAADVQRYLNDEPVVACPPSAGYRLRKLVRRNRRLIAATGLVAAALVAGTAVSIWQAIRARDAQNVAEERFELAKDAVDRYLNQVTETPELKNANFEELRKKLLESALPFYQKLAEQAPGDPEREAARGGAYLRVGKIRQEMGEHAIALTDYEKARSIFIRLAEEHSNVPIYRRDLAGSHINLGTLLRHLGKQAEAETEYRAALKERQRLAEEHPNVPEYRSDLAKSHNGPGILLNGLGRLAEAVTEYRTALKEQQRLADEHPNVPEYGLHLAQCHFNLGTLLHHLGKQAEAEIEYRAALKEHQRLADEHPSIPEYRNGLARSHSGVGALLAALGKRADADIEYRAAIKEQQRLAEEHPNVPDYRSELAASHRRLGDLLAALGKRADADIEYRAAIKEQQRLAEEHPNIPEYRNELATSRNDLGVLLAHLGKRVEAETEYRAALKEQQRLADEHPNVPVYRFGLSNSHNNLGLLLAGLGKRVEAETEYRAALKEQQRLADEHPNVPQYLIGLGGRQCNFGTLLRDRKQPERALEWYAKAIATLDGALRQVKEDVTARQFLRNAHWGRALALDALKRYAEAAPDWDKAIELSPEPERAQARMARAVCRVRLGQAEAALKEAEELAKNADANTLYDAACVFAVACAAPGPKPGQPGEKETRARHALELLRQAVAKGYNNVEHMKNDDDLAALRQRDDFKKLIAELEGKQKPVGAAAKGSVQGKQP